jgi:hypothetical protein
MSTSAIATHADVSNKRSLATFTDSVIPTSITATLTTSPCRHPFLNAMDQPSGQPQLK